MTTDPDTDPQSAPADTHPTDGSNAFTIGPHVDEVAAMVRSAGRLSLDWYRNLDLIENKKEAAGAAGYDPVTEADRAVERALRDALAERFPGHAILGEEFGATGDGPYRWIIDPIDGTRAFITGQPMWGTLLGLQIEGHPVAGWMYQPVLDETYVGHGISRLITSSATTRITVSGTAAVADAIVLSTDPSMFEPGPEAEAYARVADRAKLVRYSGDCVNYGLLALGLVDLVVENQLKDYDIVPLIPIVEGAGGIITDLDGNLPVDGGYVVAAATEALHAETISLLRG
ncbi:MAG: inositol monophosphatase family protein [Actinomycetota bacterium]